MRYAVSERSARRYSDVGQKSAVDGAMLASAVSARGNLLRVVYTRRDMIYDAVAAS